MPCSTFWDRTRNSRLSPVCCLEIEDYEVGKVGSVFVLAAEYQKLVSLIQGSSMTY
jgi:hypothetical protein